MKDQVTINKQILIAERELAALDAKRTALQNRIRQLNHLKQAIADEQFPFDRLFESNLTNDSNEEQKIALFRSLFRGREDVYPRRFESKRTGKSGFQPVCRNEWVRPICQKPKIKCGDCENRDFMPLSNDVIRHHLIGIDPTDRYRREFVIGVYPMLVDETCWFLAVDFDKEAWKENSKAYLETCRRFNVPAALERSRSGNGGHIWIFFSEPLPAKLARQLGAFMLTQAMETRPEMGFNSYDRFFPSQDTLPRGGFGNLIALPLQAKAREEGNSLFLDENFNPYSDQWRFLSAVRRMNLTEVQSVIEKAAYRGGVLGVRFVSSDEDDISPWLYSPSGKRPEIKIVGPLPDSIELVLANQIYVSQEYLPAVLKNKLIRLAAFQNPEFYKAQAMRFPTFDKPRIVHCCEDFPKHIGLPRGCLEDTIQLFHSLGIKTEIKDERFEGDRINAEFSGKLRPEQQSAADALLEYDTGVLSASTAFGKTVVAVYLIAKRSVNTLILVHLKELLYQWIDRLNAFLNVTINDIGQIGGGKRKPTGIIDVATIQSLGRKGIVDDIVGNYGHLVVDECHHISARSFEIVARQCKAKFVTGLSATVTRKDGHHPIIFMNCGPVRYKVDDKKQAAARPFAHKVKVRETNFRMPAAFESNQYTVIHEIYNALLQSEERNQIIVADVMKAIHQNRFPVILTERKEHLETIKSLLEHKIQNLIVMKGGMGKKQRQAALNALESLPDDAEKAVLATGRYLGEGFDDERLDTLFLTLPISWRGTLNQYAGRLHRIHKSKKEVMIYDYADFNVPVLARMFERRLKGYRSIGYEIEGDNS
ncbi:MAG: DEAD/DEAH box helicase family protein [Desulfobacterales bacterium]